MYVFNVIEYYESYLEYACYLKESTLSGTLRLVSRELPFTGQGSGPDNVYLENIPVQTTEEITKEL